MKKIIFLLLFIPFFSFGQDFYIHDIIVHDWERKSPELFSLSIAKKIANENLYIEKTYSEINPKWKNLNAGDAELFLRDSGFKEITNQFKKVFSAKFIHEKYRIVRKLFFEDSKIVRYADKIEFYIDCESCYLKEDINSYKYQLKNPRMITLKGRLKKWYKKQLPGLIEEKESRLVNSDKKIMKIFLDAFRKSIIKQAGLQTNLPDKLFSDKLNEYKFYSINGKDSETMRYRGAELILDKEKKLYIFLVTKEVKLINQTK